MSTIYDRNLTLAVNIDFFGYTNLRIISKSKNNEKPLPCQRIAFYA